MELHAISAGTFKLDGGAMFGVVPRVLWERHIQPDANNRCTWAMRCLLVVDGERRVLIDTGMGDKQDAKFFSHFEPGGPSALDSLQALGLAAEDITDVLLTHLHFDHCGGAVARRGDRLMPAFPRATYWSHAQHWDWAMSPNPREKASFLRENFEPLQASGQLRFVEDGGEVMPGLRVEAFYGHTEAMLVPHIAYRGHTLVFLADLQPSLAHFPLPWVMGYDIRPLVTLSERSAFLERAVERDYRFFFEHDAVNECCTLARNERGVVGPGEVFRLSEWC